MWSTIQAFPLPMMATLNVLLLLTFVSIISGRSIYVHPKHGMDTTDCYASNSSTNACRTLDWAFANRLSETSYILSPGVHYLEGPLATFLDLSDLSFIGSGSLINNTIIHCTSDLSGLAFHSVIRISFLNLTVYNCSSMQNSTSKNFHQFAENNVYTVYMFPVGVYFFNCANVTFDHVTVDNTPCGTGVVMYDTFGQNSISSSVFTNNVASNKLHNPGGGGFYVEFTYCIPGDENCHNDRSNVVSYFSNNTNSSYVFSDCIFANNEAQNADSGSMNSTYILPYRDDHEAFGRGGGLSIFIKGNASKNLFTISDCLFENNTALWGGGLFVEFHDDTFSNRIIVMNSNMTNNFCPFKPDSGTAGGGMRIGHYVYGSEIIQNRTSNHLMVSNCIFDSNAALDGGGLSISPTSENVAPNQVANVDILNTHFINNYGKLGAALHIDRFVMVLDGFVLNVVVTDCTFKSNSIDYIEYLQNRSGETYGAFQVGAGAVYINQVPVSFTSDAHFSFNIGSAIAVVGTGVKFTSCSAQFHHNSGNNGGAIALLGAAYIVVNDKTVLSFKNNKASLFGGAIFNLYIERENLISYTNCFIRHVDKYLRPESWDTHFIFHNNTDKEGTRSSAIYTTSILPCSRAGGSGISKDKDTIFCWNSLRWDYKPVTCTSQIFSDVGNIQAHNTTYSSNYHVEAFPGHQFKLPVTILDDLDASVGDVTVFSATVNSSNISYIWDKQATVHGLENASFAFRLDTISERVWEVNINVDLQPCPPGFKLKEMSCKCAGRYIRAIDCDQERFIASILENNWIGKIESNNSYYFVSFCPPYYCSSKSVLLPKKSSEINDKLCAPNHRKKTMCGECIDGFGVAVNSPTYKCVKCTSSNMGGNIVTYIAAVYIPLVVLFTVIILFNIRLTSGPANAFILFCQVIAGTFDLDADGQISITETTGNVTAENLDEAYQLIYGVFNLQFFERFIPHLCLGFFNTLDVFLVEYTVALFPLVMIIIVLVVFKFSEYGSRFCKRKTKRPRISHVSQHSSPKRTVSSSILPAFAAFILLSYTKFSIVSAHMLLSQPLFDEYGAPIGSSRVYYAGQFSTDSEGYFMYKVIAYVVYCTFVAIPPILLLDFPRRVFERVISRIDCIWRYYPADKVQIFLDTFQGCYKNKMRFFAGLYFVFRLVINTTYIFTHNWFDQYLIQQVACCVMVALLAICQPYNENHKVFNTIDILIFTDLGIINALSNYFLTQSNSSHSSLPIPALVTQCILLYLPLVYMISYIVFLALSPCKQRIKQQTSKILVIVLGKFERRGSTWLQTLVADRASQYTGSEHEKSEEVMDEEEALLQRAQRRNTYRPVTRTVVEVDDIQDNSSGNRDQSGSI